MSERPIIFSAPMVRAILDGRKTQTRRSAKPQPHPEFLARGVVDVVPQWPLQDGVRWFMADGCSELIRCPYGKPGDRLWVREAFSVCQGPAYGSGQSDTVVVYAADGKTEGSKYKPSIHMPRWASRITLDITGVRVERLQEISEADAKAEGCPSLHPMGTAKGWFGALWDSINGTGSWAADPFVWVIEFQRAPDEQGGAK